MPPAPGMRELTERQVEEFLENGWLLLEGVIDPQLCAQWREAAWERIGLHPEGPWSESMVRVPPTNSKPISEAAPRAWRAICDLIGGEDRAAAPPNFRNFVSRSTSAHQTTCSNHHRRRRTAGTKTGGAFGITSTAQSRGC